MVMTFSKDAHFLSSLRSFNSPHGVSPNLGSKAAAAAAPFENNFQKDRKMVWKSRGQSSSPRPFKRKYFLSDTYKLPEYGGGGDCPIFTPGSDGPVQ